MVIRTCNIRLRNKIIVQNATTAANNNMQNSPQVDVIEPFANDTPKGLKT